MRRANDYEKIQDVAEHFTNQPKSNSKHMRVLGIGVAISLYEVNQQFIYL